MDAACRGNSGTQAKIINGPFSSLSKRIKWAGVLNNKLLLLYCWAHSDAHADVLFTDQIVYATVFLVGNFRMCVKLLYASIRKRHLMTINSPDRNFPHRIISFLILS